VNACSTLVRARTEKQCWLLRASSTGISRTPGIHNWGERMRKNTVLSLLFALALVLSMMGCEDTKARQENEQLKAHVAELVKEIGNLQSSVDELTQENAPLKQENDQLKRTAKTKKTKKSKHHRSSSSEQ
jgi:cell division protein FtsB